MTVHSLFPLDQCTPLEYTVHMIVIRRLLWDSWNKETSHE
jgi:hypothetical protein